jgi:hypothetical protein
MAQAVSVPKSKRVRKGQVRKKRATRAQRVATRDARERNALLSQGQAISPGKMAFAATMDKRIAEAIDAERNRIDMGPEGSAWVDTVINPFRDGIGFDQIRRAAVMMPDSSDTDAVVMTLTSNGTYAGSTATTGIIEMFPPLYNNGASVYAYYGGDPSSAASSPTTIAAVGAFAESSLFSTILGSTGKYRIIGSGLKINCVSGTDTQSGTLEGGEWNGNLHGSDVSHYTTYSTAITSLETGLHEVKEGVTVHGKIRKENRDFTTAPTAVYGGTAGDQFLAYGSRPLVRFTGLAATTILSVQAVYYLEVKVNRNTCPLILPKRSTEPEFDQMATWANNQAFVTAGHSFKSFFAGVGRAAKTVFRIVRESPTLLKAATSLFA